MGAARHARRRCGQGVRERRDDARRALRALVSTVAAAQPPPGTRSPRYTELDALRGAAAVSIVALHAYQNSRTIEGYAYGDNYVVRNLIINLDFGLGVFFALSGFVVFLPFAKALIDGRPHMGVREFTT